MALESGSDITVPGSRRDYLKLFMALCFVSAVGIAGTTYTSTLDADPDEIIDIKHEWLPIGKEPIQKFKEPETSATDESGDEGSEEQGGCTDGVVGVFANLFPPLIPPCGPFYLFGLILPVLLFPAGIALAYRYRRRLIVSVSAVRTWLDDRRGTTPDASMGTWPREEPANEIHRAWLTMVQEANIEQPWTRTPRECAWAATDAGLEADAVDTITQLFVDVRYGDAPPTDERRQQARYYHQQLVDGSDKQLADGSGEFP